MLKKDQLKNKINESFNLLQIVTALILAAHFDTTSL